MDSPNKQETPEMDSLKKKPNDKICHVTPTANRTGPANVMIRSMNSSTSLPIVLVANGELVNQDDRVATNATVSGSPSQQHSLENPENQINGNSPNPRGRSRAWVINTLADMIKDLENMEATLATFREKTRPMPQQHRFSEE